MAITKDFKTIRLTDMLEATGLRGKNLNFLTDLTKEQLLNLFKAAEMIEPYSKSGWKNIVQSTLPFISSKPDLL